MSLLVLHEKNGERYFSYDSIRELGLLARYIVQERIEENVYVDASPKISEHLKRVTLEGNLASAIAVLTLRNKYEYEGFTIESSTNVKELGL